MAITDSQDFNNIIRRLKETEESLRQSKECLDATVNERTAELLQSNKELSESEEKFRNLFENIPVGIFVHDRESGQVIAANRRALDSNAVGSLEELCARDCWLPEPYSRQDTLRWIRRAASEGPQHFEWKDIDRAGNIFWRDVNLMTIPLDGMHRIVAIAQDITERKHAEEALRESEELYRLLTELSPSSVTVTDTSGIIRMVNPKALELFRHAQASEAIGRPLFEWVSAESEATAAAAFQELFLKGSVTGLELRCLRRDGTEFMGEISGSVLNDSQGQSKLVIIVTSDITERKQAEEVRLKLQKLEAVGTLAGVIAHDFNNLLQGVFGYISMARLKMDDKEKAQAMLDQAEKALSMSVNLTTQLLTFAKGGKPVRKNIVLKPIIENAAKFALSGSKCSCRMTLSEDLWPADADEGQIGQVLQNIVMNAREAMPEGGTIEVSAANKEITDSRYGLLPAGGRFVMISVRDSGIGISEQYLAKIFDPYFTTKQRGSGLGLATSYCIVRNHGGMIDVMSEAGKGTTFCIYLPTAESEEGTGQPQGEDTGDGR